MNNKRKEKLQKLLDQPEGIAIAITGAWGVGKTHFWQEFIKSYPLSNNQRYAYISVFGVESLSDLKALIVEQLGASTDNSSDLYTKTTKLAKSVLKDIKGLNVNGLNLGGGILFSLLFNRVSNCLICIDDMERKSDKLNTKDIMGLVDFLKNQRKCKVVVILNDKKNNEIYDEYKEKVFDENLILKDISEALAVLVSNEIEIVKQEFLRFYEIFKLENLRFYKKALRIFHEIYNYLPVQRTDNAVEQIVQSNLVFLAITDIPSIDLGWEDLNLSIFENNKDEKKAIKNLRKFYGNYFNLTEWDYLLKKFFEQDQTDWKEDDFRKLAESDLLSESKQLLKDQLENLIDSFFNLSIDFNFADELYDLASKNIGSISVPSICFYIELLNRNGVNEKAELLEKKLLEWIKSEIRNDPRHKAHPDRFFIGGHSGYEDIYGKIKLIIDNIVKVSGNLTETMNNYINDKSWSSFDKYTVINSTKEDWKKFLFEDITESRFEVIRSIWNQQIAIEKNADIHNWIKEFLNEKAQESVAMNVAVRHILSLLNPDENIDI